MLKIENGEIEVEGSAEEITKEWMNLTYAICSEMGKAMGCNVSLQELIMGGNILLQKEQEGNKDE